MRIHYTAVTALLVRTALALAAIVGPDCSTGSAQNTTVSDHPDLILVLEPTAHFYDDAVRGASAGIPILSAVPDWMRLSDCLHDLGSGADEGDLASVRKAVADIASVLTNAGVDPTILQKHREVLVISPRPVPLDLLIVAGEPLGRRVIFEHLVAANSREARAVLPEDLREDRETLRRLALLAIVPMPEGIPRQDQDIVKAALKLSARVPVEIVVGPSGPEAVQYFSRADVSILHLDTHGSQRAVELGTNEEHYYTAGEFPKPIRPPLILLVGCSTGAQAESIAPYLVRQGARAVIGMAFVFRSGDPSGGDITDPVFYDTLWTAIAQGQPVGEAMLRAKRALPNNEWSVMWLLFGNANLRFAIERSR